LKGYFKALEAVEAEGKVEVPNHLKDDNRDAAALGHGKGYQYPHEFPDHWVEQQYMPDAIKEKEFYRPSDQGHEKQIAEEWKKRRGKSGEGRQAPTTIKGAKEK
jgi:putative ATPase